MCQSDYALKVEIMYIERFWIMGGGEAARSPGHSKQKQTQKELACSRLSE